MTLDATTPSGGTRVGRGTRVLVIDDSDTARAQMKLLLENAGYVVETLPSAIGATRAVMRLGVSAIVVDISMPGISGDRLVEMLRSQQRLQKLIIIVVSGCLPDELEKIRARCKADEAVAKSELSHSLVPAIARNLCRASAARLNAVRVHDDNPPEPDPGNVVAKPGR